MSKIKSKLVIFCWDVASDCYIKALESNDAEDYIRWINIGRKIEKIGLKLNGGRSIVIE